MLDEILARHHHAAFGWRVSDYASNAYTEVSREELIFYLRCHAFLAPAGHPLTEMHVEYCTRKTGVDYEDLALTRADREDAIRWHFLVRPHVAGEGWNRRDYHDPRQPRPSQ